VFTFTRRIYRSLLANCLVPYPTPADHVTPLGSVAPGAMAAVCYLPRDGTLSLITNYFNYELFTCPNYFNYLIYTYPSPTPAASSLATVTPLGSVAPGAVAVCHLPRGRTLCLSTN